MRILAIPILILINLLLCVPAHATAYKSANADDSIMATLPRLADIAKLPDSIVIGKPSEESRRKFVMSYPEWVGGEECMNQWIHDNLRYPREAFAKGVRQLSPLCIHITDQGSVDSIFVAWPYSGYSMADTIAWDLVGRMPRWQPAIGLNGRPTGFWYYIGVKVDHPVFIEREHEKWERYKQEHPEDENHPTVLYSTSDAMIQPEFPGGEREMFDWIDKHTIYPSIMYETDITCRVSVVFTIDRQGFIKDVRLARGKHPALDAEAIRVVSNFPRWSPGFGTESTVEVNYLVPVSFKLESSVSKK